MNYKHLYITDQGHIVETTPDNHDEFYVYKHLCSKVIYDYAFKKLSKYICYFYKYRYNYLCKDCLNKLPKKMQDKLKFNYIVYKLKK